MSTKEIIISSETTENLPEKFDKLKHIEILRVRCPRLREMPSSLGCLISLKTLDLRNNAVLEELPVALGTLTSIKNIYVSGCPLLHTPPKHVIVRGTDAMLQFLRDLDKGEAPSYLIKVVLLGDQRAGKSSLVDSLVQGKHAPMRPFNDRTVGIEVRRWRLGQQSPVVANIYDAAGQRVYRATHGFFMSPGALFLHVVRSDLPEKEAVMALLEWVEAVQQEAPGAVMGVVWTYTDCVNKAAEIQTRVLAQLNKEIGQQVQEMDDVLRELEDGLMFELGEQHQTELAGWAQTREQRDELLTVLDRLSMTACHAADDTEEMLVTLTKLKTQHEEMRKMEEQMAKAVLGNNCLPLDEQLQKLRQQREQRPRILCSHGVSNLTGQGLPELRQALAMLMEDKRLFAHVGAKVPLNYSMLERLAHQGRAQASEEAEYVEKDNEADHAEWERRVTNHVKERSTERLRAVCGQACVTLGDLEQAALADGVAMDKAEVHSALLFLHATGSVLHYGTDTRRGSKKLQGTVFMQPQFIINAIKYVIREPCADDVNDEMRKLDVRIRQNASNGEALDRFLGTHEAHGSGVLTRQLLTQVWRHLNPQYHMLLLELMKVFMLLRPLADKDFFLVPAMLPQRALPDEYVTPDWWRPAKAANVAVMKVQGVSHRAEMRIMYKVLCGRFPFGFMSELQVRLAQIERGDQDEEFHFASEAAVVDRVSGSVLSEAYMFGEGTVREWAILSQAHAKEAAAGKASNSLRVMGWAEVSTLQGATDWRLFQRVLQAIEDMAQSAPGLSLQKMAFHVDSSGKLAKPLIITRKNEKRQVFSFALEGGAKIDVCRDLVLPSLLETKLSPPTAASEGARYRVDAFFAQKIDDKRINVYAEGQLMMREMLNPVNAGSRWDCNVNPQPTLGDLRSSIASCRERSVRVLHLAGHGRKECGFIWNASDAATQSQEFDVDAISLAIGMAAGDSGPLECVVLNACSTEKMGRLLRTNKVPYVICWRTPVQDETAKLLCQLFYNALVQDGSGARDYRRAFLAASDTLRSSAHTGGSKIKLRGADDATVSNAVLHFGTTRDGILSILREEGVGGAAHGHATSRGQVNPWHVEDVVLFLSKDGDTEPIYLWREPKVPPSPPTPTDDDVPPGTEEYGGAEEPGDASLKALFSQHGLGALCVDVCRELGVNNVCDLAYVKPEDVDDLPNYVKSVHKRKLKDMMESQASLATQVPASVHGGPPAEAGTSAASTRHGDRGGQQQVFLGYRVASDVDLVERLHDKLRAEGVKVWWDKRSLPAGQAWEQGFVDGLCSCDVFVPVLSKAGLASFAQLTAASACDNVLLEHQLALELRHRSLLRAIFPVFVGEVQTHQTLGELHGNFLESGGIPNCDGDVMVEAVEGKLVQHLQRLGMGDPLLPASSRSVKATLNGIKSNQGVKLEGLRFDTMDIAVAAIVKLASQ